MVYFNREAMRITIRPLTPLSLDLRERTERRFAFALGRFGDLVRSLTIRLADVNGPRGGHDKLCSVSVQLATSRRAIVIEDVDARAETAIDRAADRAARAVARAVDAMHEWRGDPRRRRR
jgi:hypothetical protein